MFLVISLLATISPEHASEFGWNYVDAIKALAPTFSLGVAIGVAFWSLKTSGFSKSLKRLTLSLGMATAVSLAVMILDVYAYGIV